MHEWFSAHESKEVICMMKAIRNYLETVLEEYGEMLTRFDRA